jgi:exodeoxyribonuclease VII large subunit
LAELVLFPSLVQGDGAPAQLIRGLRTFRDLYPVDVIIIGRGGGSLEELWAFNDEALAREIFDCPIPVISAVGHETDFSISDFVADLRAPTPSAAAELALPEAGEVKRKLNNVTDRLSLVCQGRVTALKGRLDSLASARQMQNMMALVDDRRMAVSALDEKMDASMEKSLTYHRNRLLHQAAKLEALSPLAVLTRGYSALFSPDGKSVTSKKQISSGDKVTLRLSDGKASAQILEVEE